MKRNRGIVMNAVKQFRCALKFASKDMKIDRGIVTAALNQNGEAIEFAS